MHFRQKELVLEFSLTGNAEHDAQLLPHARILPGFDEEALQQGVCRIRLPLDEAGGLRDVLFDLWGMAASFPDARLTLDGEALGLEELKQVLRVVDCAATRGVGQSAATHCHASRGGWDWGCLLLSRISPQTGMSETGLNKEQLKSTLQKEADRLRLHLCPHFYLARIVAKVDALTDQAVASLQRETSHPGRVVVPDLPSTGRDKAVQQTIPVVTYADVGGMDEVILTLRETIELPLKHPEILRRMGIAPHKGVLLHGPPGCGKTLLARAVAHESKARFIPISGPELITKWHGESEEKLRQVFAQARESQPAIVFFDEIDAIAQSRSSDESLRLDARFTAQLLTLMDGVHDPGQVVVLAATNRPDLLDEALLRPGRFDAIIEIPRPDSAGCLKILGIHARKLPLGKNVNLKSFARKLRGLTGADIAYVVRETAYTALRRTFCLEEILGEGKELPEQQLVALTATMEDFHAALDKLLARNVAKHPRKTRRKQRPS